MFNAAKTVANSVRCVSNGLPPGTGPSADNGDGTVTNTATHLIWQKYSAGLDKDDVSHTLRCGAMISEGVPA